MLKVGSYMAHIAAAPRRQHARHKPSSNTQFFHKTAVQVRKFSNRGKCCGSTCDREEASASSHCFVVRLLRYSSARLRYLLRLRLSHSIRLFLLLHSMHLFSMRESRASIAVLAHDGGRSANAASCGWNALRGAPAFLVSALRRGTKGGTHALFRLAVTPVREAQGGRISGGGGCRGGAWGLGAALPSSCDECPEVCGGEDAAALVPVAVLPLH